MERPRQRRNSRDDRTSSLNDSVEPEQRQRENEGRDRSGGVQ